VDLAFFPSSFGEYGAVKDITEDSLTIGHLFRAAFDNMAYNYQRAAKMLSPERSWRRIAFSGGLAQRMPALRNVIGSAFGSSYRVSAVDDESLLGLLALAMLMDGRVGSLAQATAVLQDRYPSPPAA
jgi:sugar (pentulose or hexulose) kinase